MQMTSEEDILGKITILNNNLEYKNCGFSTNN